MRLRFHPTRQVVLLGDDTRQLQALDVASASDQVRVIRPGRGSIRLGRVGRVTVIVTAFVGSSSDVGVIDRLLTQLTSIAEAFDERTARYVFLLRIRGTGRENRSTIRRLARGLLARIAASTPDVGVRVIDTRGSRPARLLQTARRALSL